MSRFGFWALLLVCLAYGALVRVGLEGKAERG